MMSCVHDLRRDTAIQMMFTHLMKPLNISSVLIKRWPPVACIRCTYIRAALMIQSNDSTSLYTTPHVTSSRTCFGQSSTETHIYYETASNTHSDTSNIEAFVAITPESG